MVDLFSDIFARRDNKLTRLDARVKLILAISAVMAVSFSKTVLFPLVIAMASVGSLTMVNIPNRIILLRLAAPGGMIVVLVMLQMFLTKGDPLLVIPFGHWELIATREGLMRGLLLGARVLGAVSVVLLLGAVTPAYKIFHALRWLGVPASWVEIALLVYRYVFTLLDDAADIAAAQSTRLGYSSVKRSLASAGILAGTVITRSLAQAVRTYEAMTLRGYTGQLPFGPLPRLSGNDWLHVGGGTALLAILYFLFERWAV